MARPPTRARCSSAQNRVMGINTLVGPNPVGAYKKSEEIYHICHLFYFSSRLLLFSSIGLDGKRFTHGFTSKLVGAETSSRGDVCALGCRRPSPSHAATRPGRRVRLGPWRAPVHARLAGLTHPAQRALAVCVAMARARARKASGAHAHCAMRAAHRACACTRAHGTPPQAAHGTPPGTQQVDSKVVRCLTPCGQLPPIERREEVDTLVEGGKGIGWHWND